MPINRPKRKFINLDKKMFNKILIFFVICLINLIIFLWYRKFSLNMSYGITYFFGNFSLTEDEICTTKWYKQYDLEFNVFSTEYFSKVIFLMDHGYSQRIPDDYYQCVFFQYGTNRTLKPEPLNRIGGKDVHDPHQHTFCLECQIPSKAIHKSVTKINFTLVAKNNSSKSMNISICRFYEHFLNSKILNNESKLEIKSKNNGIAACTQTYKGDLQFPLWINYHYKMGIKHFYIYDHTLSSETTLHINLKEYIDLNIVTIVPWHIDQWDDMKYYPVSEKWITHQIWSQNDCIRRYGYLHSWILISDVDEYVIPAGNFSNFIDLLNTIPPFYCAFQILHYSFRRHINESLPEIDRPKKMFNRRIKHEYPNAQSKNFVRSKLIHYFSVHQVTRSVDSAPVFYGDVDKHARLHHYQPSVIPQNDLAIYIFDNRTLLFMNQINTSISSII